MILYLSIFGTNLNGSGMKESALKTIEHRWVLDSFIQHRNRGAIFYRRGQTNDAHLLGNHGDEPDRLGPGGVGPETD